jgi:hypothetical protein
MFKHHRLLLMIGVELSKLSHFLIKLGMSRNTEREPFHAIPDHLFALTNNQS